MDCQWVCVKLAVARDCHSERQLHSPINLILSHCLFSLLANAVMMVSITGDPRGTITLLLLLLFLEFLSPIRYTLYPQQGSQETARLLIVCFYYMTHHQDGWLKITNHKYWYNPTTQSAATLRRILVWRIWSFSTFLQLSCWVAPFRWDKCCHLLLSHHITWLKPAKSTPSTASALSDGFGLLLNSAQVTYLLGPC